MKKITIIIASILFFCSYGKAQIIIHTSEIETFHNLMEYIEKKAGGIYKYGGHEKLKYVIENPEKLLSVFNELYTESMLIPRIPDDIVNIWQNNL